MAKLIVKLITPTAEVVIGDPQTNDLSGMVFVPNGRASPAERIIPAARYSMDRAHRVYAREIWTIRPRPVDGPGGAS